MNQRLLAGALGLALAGPVLSGCLTVHYHGESTEAVVGGKTIVLGKPISTDPGGPSHGETGKELAEEIQPAKAVESADPPLQSAETVILDLQPVPVGPNVKHSTVRIDSGPGHKEKQIGAGRRSESFGEYLLWWIKGSSLPPLVTQNAGGTPAVLGLLDTAVLVGGDNLDNEERSGGRFMLSSRLDHAETMGLEGSYLFLGTRELKFHAGGSGAPGSQSLGRPYVNALTGMETVHVLAAPGSAAGNVFVAASSRLQGVELNGVGNLYADCLWSVDALAGFRYFQLDEGLHINESVTVLSGAASNGPTSWKLADEFDAHNRFYGGQLGLRADYQNGRVFVTVQGKVALGQVHEIVGINGYTVATGPGGGAIVRGGGLLGLPSNTGRITREAFAVLPEGTVRFGYLAKTNTRYFVGYNFLYLSDVARPGDQVDRTLNPRQLPFAPAGEGLGGPRRPAAVVHATDFWAQGFLVGVEWRY